MTQRKKPLDPSRSPNTENIRDHGQGTLRAPRGKKEAMLLSVGIVHTVRGGEWVSPTRRSPAKVTALLPDLVLLANCI